MTPPNPMLDPETPLEKKLDTKTVEVLALAVFRTMFGHGIRVPLRMGGMMDMDLVIRDGNVLLNMNKVQVEVPELLLWRITFAYHGKSVIDYGRGVKNNMKIHFPQLFVFMMAAWRSKVKKNKEKALGDQAMDVDLATMALSDPELTKPEDITAR